MINLETRERLEKRWTHLTTIGVITPGVSEDFNPLLSPPEWYDPERYKRAQQLVKNNFLRYLSKNREKVLSKLRKYIYINNTVLMVC